MTFSLKSHRYIHAETEKADPRDIEESGTHRDPEGRRQR